MLRSMFASPHVLAGDEIVDDVLHRVVTSVLSRCQQAGGPLLDEVVHETIFAEQARLADAADGGKAAADRQFVGWLRHELAAARSDAARRDLVSAIVKHYSEEISGHFDARVYRATTRVLPGALGALLHGDVDERVLVEGEVEALEALVRAGTIMLVPSHVSNLDAVLLGYAIFRLGLPPFAYGAGLNLFSSPTAGFFMRNLGAYTVDRKKTDPIYKDTLKEYACELLEHGQHTLFFPGGTRSRSGAVETHLKKGLLGTAPRAFRRAIEQKARRPRIFVVPCTLTYPLVLEAATLVGDYLRAQGGPHYVDVHDEFDRPRRWLSFLRGILRLDLRIHVRIGRALDPVGNPVSADGQSHDGHGRPVDPGKYFLAGGRLAADEARDAEYARALEAEILATYRRDTVAIPTSILTWAVFQRLRCTRRQPDLFRLLRGLEVGAEVPEAVVQDDIARALEELRELEGRGAIRLAPELARARPSDVVNDALPTLAAYHPVPVVERRGSRLRVGDPNLLYYYSSRLGHVGLRSP